MAKITSKLQVTIPKAIADRFALRPGTRVAFVPAGDAIRVVPEDRAPARADVAARLHWFDQATERQRSRERKRSGRRPPKSRGWQRDQLYTRGLPRRH